jgi:isopropylmalate/homocitrate/citramalate synthase
MSIETMINLREKIQNRCLIKQKIKRLSLKFETENTKPAFDEAKNKKTRTKHKITQTERKSYYNSYLPLCFALHMAISKERALVSQENSLPLLLKVN